MSLKQLESNAALCRAEEPYIVDCQPDGRDDSLQRTGHIITVTNEVATAEVGCSSYEALHHNPAGLAQNKTKCSKSLHVTVNADTAAAT